MLFFISTATTSPAPMPREASQPPDLADPLVEGRIGDVFAAVFQRTAIRGSPRMKGDKARKIDHTPLKPGRFIASSLPR